MTLIICQIDGVRGVGELLSIQIKGGMLKMSKMVREK